jgi:hypothetical protein
MALENRCDAEATKQAGFKDKESWVSLAGHQYLFGEDKVAIRAVVFRDATGLCCFCGRYVAEDYGDLEHRRAGRKLVRCDCYGTLLADGSICTDLRWSHGMGDFANACHRKRHNREVKWTKQSA